MLCVFDSTYQYVAQVVAKFENQKFAKEVWGETEEGKTWQLMYFLTKPVAISIKTSDLTDFLSKGYMGFSRIGEDKVSIIAVLGRQNDRGPIAGTIRVKRDGGLAGIGFATRSSGGI